MQRVAPAPVGAPRSPTARRRAAVAAILTCAALAALATGAGGGARRPSGDRLSLQQQWAAPASQGVEQFAQPQSYYGAQAQLPPQMAAQQQLQAQVEPAPVPMAPVAPPAQSMAPVAPPAAQPMAQTAAAVRRPAPAPASAGPVLAPAAPPPAAAIGPVPPERNPLPQTARAGGYGSAGPTSAAEGNDESIEDYQKVKKERRFAMDFCDAKFNSWANVQKCIHELFSTLSCLMHREREREREERERCGEMDPDYHAYGMRRARGVRRARGGLYARAGVRRARAVRRARPVRCARHGGPRRALPQHLLRVAVLDAAGRCRAERRCVGRCASPWTGRLGSRCSLLNWPSRLRSTSQTITFVVLESISLSSLRCATGLCVHGR